MLDVTPSAVIQSDGQNYCRGHEIKDWLDKHAAPNTSYLIIDDAAEMLDTQQSHFVRVNLEKGFATRRSMYRAATILGG